ncbi:hypothetical protein YPPY01_1861, partial [Yersinia pestis PY-01]
MLCACLNRRLRENINCKRLPPTCCQSTAERIPASKGA